MKTNIKLLLASAVIVPATLLAALPANAQVGGIAVVDPEAAILSANALGAANSQIATSYKTQLDQAHQRQLALQAEILRLVDTNKDGQISEAEAAAARSATGAMATQLQTAQTSAQTDLDRLTEPSNRAQAYAIEQIALKYGPAVTAVVAAKKISLLLSANEVQFAQPAVDVTDDIKAELDRAVPTVTITPPAGWQPQQQTVQLLQRYRQAVAAQQQRAQQQAGAAAPGTASATPAPAGRRPQGR